MARILEHWQTGFIFNVSSGNPRTVIAAHMLYATGNQNLDAAQNRADLVAPPLFSADTKGHLVWDPAGNHGFFYGASPKTMYPTCKVLDWLSKSCPLARMRDNSAVSWFCTNRCEPESKM